MTGRNSLLRRLTAGVGAFALATAGILATSVAHAAPGAEGTPPGNAAPGTTGKLTVHKYAGSTTGQANNGTPITVNRPPLAGVTFTLCKAAGIDLTTAAGWTAAQTATPASVTCQTGTTQSLTTGPTGVVTFDPLAIGLYLVKETAQPVGVTPAANFLVSIPYPSVSGSGEAALTTWLYDVHVYPKNTLEGTGSKTVADPNAHGLGSLVPWSIKTRPLGSFNGGAPLTAYKIVDVMVPQLEFDSTTALQYLTPGGTLTTVPAANYTQSVSADLHTATITFNSPTGLAWVNSLPAGTTFQWDLKTKVVGVGALDNKAYENIGGDDFLIGTVHTDWGAARLFKFDQNHPTQGLAGAEFKVFDANPAGACSAVNPETDTPITVSGQTIFTSDPSGNVNIAGLWVGNNGSPTTRVYCVAETKAPAGYTADGAAKAITVAAGSVAENSYSLRVPNLPKRGPELPLTGSTGSLAFGIVGLGLIAAAGATFAVRRRRLTH